MGNDGFCNSNSIQTFLQRLKIFSVFWKKIKDPKSFLLVKKCPKPDIFRRGLVMELKNLFPISYRVSLDITNFKPLFYCGRRWSMRKICKLGGKFVYIFRWSSYDGYVSNRSLFETHLFFKLTGLKDLMKKFISNS